MIVDERGEELVGERRRGYLCEKHIGENDGLRHFDFHVLRCR